VRREEGKREEGRGKREQGAGNRTGNREQGTGKREEGREKREQTPRRNCNGKKKGKRTRGGPNNDKKAGGRRTERNLHTLMDYEAFSATKEGNSLANYVGTPVGRLEGNTKGTLVDCPHLFLALWRR
jgi:hypothetical protein